MATTPKKDPLSLNNLSPYFQVVVFKKENYDRKIFKTLLENRILKSQKNNKTSELKWENNATQTYAAWIETKEFPSWLSTNEKIDTTDKIPKNIENSLILINDTNTYIYVHASDKKSEDIINNIFFLDLMQSKVDIKIFYRALAELDIKIKSLGINNTFGAGGTAAEAKSYFGKDAKLSLTPSFDSGYSFSYCLGSNTDISGKVSSFGCSTKKRKFWGSWTDGAADFSQQCRDIDKILNAKNNGDFIPFLVHPFEVKHPKKLKILGFYLDYVATKGIVIPIINKIEIHDWQCQVDPSGKITIGNENNFVELQVTKIDNNSIELKYINASKNALIAISNDDKKLTRKKKTDLIEYLLNEENFTILFEEGIAFRERSFWKDNRLNTPFLQNIYTDIDWSDVDIRREDSPSSDPKKISIADKTEQYLKSNISKLNIVAIIKDGGANEAADHMIICKDQIILVHEKFSASNTPGLRIDDLQVVSSQLIKNIRYLFPTAHTPQLDRFFKRAKYLDPSIQNPKELGQAILNALTNINVQNECWIVQPGISKKKLVNQLGNKFHVLLSHLNSICGSNNTVFKLYCGK